METPPNAPNTPKSRGHTLFDRQAQRHANGSDNPDGSLNNKIIDIPRNSRELRPFYSNVQSAESSNRSPATDRRTIISKHSSNESKTNDKTLVEETDFPLIEPENNLRVNQSIPTSSLCCAMIDTAFDYLKKQNDNDDDDVVIVVDESNEFENENLSEDADSVDTIDLDAGFNNEQRNQGNFTFE